jgi:2-succinyl-5-enolpyruvyl-6-hydroxy-3-cyclohexene-1-carboxylate synthase
MRARVVHCLGESTARWKADEKMAKQMTIETAKAKTDALHAKHGTINGRVATLGKLWNAAETRWTWCERFEQVGALAPYRIEGKFLFEPTYQPS